MEFTYDDGGRKAAGFRGDAGDCVTRAVAIVSGKPYAEVYAALADGMGSQRKSKRTKPKGRSARNGVSTTRKWFKDYMRSLGFTWTPTMHIGSGCKVHLHDGELPMGRLIVVVSRHYTAVIDSVIHDTHDPQREAHVLMFNGATNSNDPRVTRSIQRRCVYGYWSQL